jgi:hypothetical protein
MLREEYKNEPWVRVAAVDGYALVISAPPDDQLDIQVLLGVRGRPVR